MFVFGTGGRSVEPFIGEARADSAYDRWNGTAGPG